MLALLIASLAAAAGGPQDPLPDPRAPSIDAAHRLEALVERMRLEQERMSSLAATFTQRKQSDMLLEPEESEGSFYYSAPDRVLWEYDAPTPISLLIDGDLMTTWYRDLDKAEQVEIGRHSQRVLEYLGAGSSLGTLLEYFDVKLKMADDPAKPLHLELEPRFARVAKRLRGMEIWVDPQLFLPVRLRYVEADGDVTDYTFGGFHINEAIPEERFQLEMPDSVSVRKLDLNRRASFP